VSRLRRLAPALALCAVVVAGIAPSALAQTNGGVTDATPQQSANKLQINKIDATNSAAVAVNFTYNGAPADLQKLTLRENGAQVSASAPQLLSSTGVHRALVLAIDISGSMVTNGGLETAKKKMHELVNGKSAGDQMGLVTFGFTAEVVQGLTDDAATLNKKIDSIHGDPKAHTAMWDGVASASATLAAAPSLQHNMILVTDGSDDASSTSAAAARGDAVNSATTVFAIGITQQHQLDKGGLTALVRAAGGRLFIAPQATSIAAAFDQVATALGNQYVTTYASNAKSGRNSLELNVGGTTQRATFTSGGVSAGAQNLKPQILPGTSGPAYLRNTSALFGGLLLFGIALGVAVYVVVQLIVSKRSGLDAMLSHYADTPTGGTAPEGESQGLAQGALLQRAVALTEGFAKDRGFLDKVEDKLELADIPLRAAEVMLFYFVAVVVITLLALVLTQNIIVGLVVLAICLLAGPALLDMRARQRQRKFTAQLPDMLNLLSGALRAGFSLMQAVDAVSQEIEDPMGKEMRRVVTEARLGRDLEEALEDTAVRTGSADFAWAVMAIRIQREVGGNLAELLMTVAETMVQRERLRREVKSLTAEGRISAIVLGLLPPALAVVMYIINPEYMSPLFHDFTGQLALGLAIVMMIVGFLWMRQVVQIDV
jgi:tight adherence protein B